MYPWCRETMTTQLYGNAVPSAAAAAAAIKTESGYGDCMLALDYAAQSKKAALVWPSQQDPSAPKSAPGGSPLGGGVVGGGGGPLVGGLHHHHHQQHQQHHHQQLLHHGGGQQGQQGAPPPHHGLSASAPPPPAAAAQGLAHWMSVMAEQINPHHEVHYMATWNGVEQCASPHAKEAEMSWPPPRHGGVFGSKYGYEAKMNSADLQGNQSGPKGEGSSDDGGGGGGRGMEPPGPSPYGGGGGPLLLPAPHAPSHPQHRSASADGGGGGMLSGGVSAPVSPSHGPASPATSLPPLDAASKAGGSPVPPGGLVPPHSHPPSANGRKFQCKGRGRKRSRGSQQIQGIGRDGPLGWPGMEQGEIFPGSKGDLHHHLGGGGGGGGGGNREAKPYKCTQCSKAFANSSYLSQHTRIHLGIKPYRCEICQRKFTQLSHLQQHIRTHTGDKPYKCRHPGCPKAFSQLSNLQSHSRCHQTDKPFKCNSCYKCFSDEPSLLEHIPKHRESKHLKTHICQYCGKSYTQETYLAKHMQKHAERTDRRPPIPRPPPQPASSDAPPPDSPPPGGPTPSSDSPHDQQPPHRATPAPSNGEPPDASQPPAQPLAYWHGVRPEHAVDSVMGTEGLPPEHRRAEHHMQHQLHQQAQQYEAKAASSAFTPIHASPPVVSSPSSSGMVHHPHHHPGMGAHPVGGRPTPPSASYLPYDPISLPKAAAMAAMDNMKSPLQHHHPHHHPHHPHHHPHHPHHLHHLPPASSAPVTSAPSASFPNQLISLHQIRNYAHQPSTVIGEHLLGLKEKGQ